MARKVALLAVLVLSAVGCGSAAAHASATSASPAPAAGARAEVPSATATVVRVVDGDTVILRIHHDEERVRLIGVDTPETVKPNTPVQCWGPQASAHMKALLEPGTAVRVARDAEARDVYGRLLLYVWRAHDGLFVNDDLATGGWARQLTIPPNTAHEQDFARGVAQAEAAGRGLWGACGAGHR